MRRPVHRYGDAVFRRIFEAGGKGRIVEVSGEVK
jgi:hypothetical protein